MAPAYIAARRAARSGVPLGPVPPAPAPPLPPPAVGCNEDIPAACRTAVNRIVLSSGTWCYTSCAVRPNDARCVNALNSCVAQTTANCQASPAAALANFHNDAVELAALQAVETAIAVE